MIEILEIGFYTPVLEAMILDPSGKQRTRINSIPVLQHC